MNDDLGDRIKKNYEDRNRYCLPRRTNTILRIDGKCFSSFTYNLKRPYDQDFMDDMDQTAVYMCQNIQGAKFAFVQSDEISIILTDYDDIKTEAWFDGNLQKMASISASLATARFNQLRVDGWLKEKCEDEWNQNDIYSCWDTKPLAHFDSRVFVIPDIEEVINYFIWRQQDATRNSIQMAGQSQFSHKQLDRISCDEIQEKLFTEKGINWNNYPTGFKRGRGVTKRVSTVTEPDGELGYRSSWIVDKEIPIFTQNREYITNHINKVWLSQ